MFSKFSKGSQARKQWRDALRILKVNYFWKWIISNLEFITQQNPMGRPKTRGILLIQDLSLSQESTTGYIPPKEESNQKKNYMIHKK